MYYGTRGKISIHSGGKKQEAWNTVHSAACSSTTSSGPGFGFPTPLRTSAEQIVLTCRLILGKKSSGRGVSAD